MISLPDLPPLNSPDLFVRPQFKDALEKRLAQKPADAGPGILGIKVIVDENLPAWVYCADGKKRELHGVMMPSGLAGKRQDVVSRWRRG